MYQTIGYNYRFLITNNIISERHKITQHLLSTRDLKRRIRWGCWRHSDVHWPTWYWFIDTQLKGSWQLHGYGWMNYCVNLRVSASEDKHFDRFGGALHYNGVLIAGGLFSENDCQMGRCPWCQQNVIIAYVLKCRRQTGQWVHCTKWFQSFSARHVVHL